MVENMSVVLFVCTGNLCRSPSAELLLERELVAHGTNGVAVHSAGTRGASFGPPERLVKEAAAFDIDLEGHVPQVIDQAMVGEADLLIGMTREHVREVVLIQTSAFSRSFTLREIVRRGQEVGPRPPHEELASWLGRLHAGRQHIDLVGDAAIDDIADPMGGNADDYRAMLHDVSALSALLRQLAWP